LRPPGECTPGLNRRVHESGCHDVSLKERRVAALRHVAAPGGHDVDIYARLPIMHPNIRSSRLDTARSLRQRAAAIFVVGATALVATSLACDRSASLPADKVETIPTAGSASVVPERARDESRGIMDGAVGRLQGKVANEVAQGADMATAPSSAPEPAPPAAMTPITTVSQPSTSSSMIIRTGFAGVEVDSLDAAIARVRALAQRVGGFVANTAVQGGKDQLRSASLEVKIPSDRFDEALAGLAPIGKVESVNVNAQDVGEEFVDIAARVENAHRLEARLIALLANRTGKLQEVLSVERELARVREEIERYEGRMRYLRTRVALSTLTVNVHERAPIIVPIAGDGPITIAFREAWRNFVGFVAGLIASLGVLIPLGAIALVGWLGVRRWAPWRTAGGTPPTSGAVSGD